MSQVSEHVSEESAGVNMPDEIFMQVRYSYSVRHICSEIDGEELKSTRNIYNGLPCAAVVSVLGKVSGR